MTTDKIRCVKVTRPDSHGDRFFCAYKLDGFSAKDEFDGADNGEKITLELCEMTADEYDALGDFEGW
jgi:hypothetical protein